MVRVAMATAGASTAGAPWPRPSMFSRTSEPQSASGGCIPRPRKLIALSNSTTYTKRRPKSVSTGRSMFGSTSTKMM
ncbi:hypothetical protein D3C81_1864550 [compost metagenome]